MALPADDIDMDMMFSTQSGRRSAGPARAPPGRSAVRQSAAAAEAAVSTDTIMSKMGIAGFGKRRRLEGPSSAAEVRKSPGGFAALLRQSITKESDVPEPAREPSPEADVPMSGTRAGPAEPARGSDPTLLPVTNSAVMNGHERAVMSLAVDHTGSSVASGGADYKVRLWRFAGMTDSLQAFRTHEPHEGYPVNDLSFSPNGDRYVASIDHLRPLIFNRDGKELAEFVMGDVYVTQGDKTRGHTASTTYAQWHPDTAELIATSSRDGTARLWDPERVKKRQLDVFQHRPRQGGRRPHCTFVGWAGKRILTATDDGRLFSWDTRKPAPGRKPDVEIAAHTGAVSCLAMAADYRVASRSLDGSVKLWDLRKASDPLAVRGGLDAHYDGTSVCFGHGDQFVVTVTGADPRQGDRGQLVLLHATDLEVAASVSVGVGSCCKAVWSPAINQILVTSQDAGVHVFYNPKSSQKGVLLSLAKRKRQDVTDYQLPERIFTPATQSMKEIFQEVRAARKSTKPQQKAPMEKWPGKVGEKKLFSGKKAMFLRDFCADTVQRQTMRDTDPREALSAHEPTDAEQTFINQAYGGQQRIFADPEEEEDGVERKVTGSALKRKLISALK